MEDRRSAKNERVLEDGSSKMKNNKEDNKEEVSWKMGEWWGTGAGFIVDDRTMCQ